MRGTVIPLDSHISDYSYFQMGYKLTCFSGVFQVVWTANLIFQETEGKKSLLQQGSTIGLLLVGCFVFFKVELTSEALQCIIENNNEFTFNLWVDNPDNSR